MSGLLAGLAALQPFGWSRNLAGYLLLWPQRWSFFTELDEAEQWAYPVRNGTFAIEPRRASDWAWGLDRGSDLRASEVWTIASRIPNEYWQECATAACTGLDSTRVHRLASPVRHPGLCGPVVIVQSTTAVPAHGLPAPPRRTAAFTDLTCP